MGILKLLTLTPDEWFPRGLVNEVCLCGTPSEEMDMVLGFFIKADHN